MLIENKSTSIFFSKYNSDYTKRIQNLLNSLKTETPEKSKDIKRDLQECLVTLCEEFIAELKKAQFGIDNFEMIKTVSDVLNNIHLIKSTLSTANAVLHEKSTKNGILIPHNQSPIYRVVDYGLDKFSEVYNDFFDKGKEVKFTKHLKKS
jgi:hypothetical protein